MLSCWMLSRFGHSRKEKGKQRVTGYVPYQPLLQEMAHLMPLRRTRYQYLGNVKYRGLYLIRVALVAYLPATQAVS